MNNNKIYRLLRNNKEQGPFTAEELIRTGLKPHDLIWADGRSAAWNFPGEMNEFKLLVATPTSELEKRISKNNAAIIQAAVAINDNIVQSSLEKQPKPRFKVSAAWSKIQTITAPLYKDVLVAEPAKVSSTKKVIVSNSGNAQYIKPLSWEQAWKDWEVEKTGTIIKQPEVVKAPSTKKLNNNVSAPMLETKFKQSLDTLTDSYIDNLIMQKKRERSFSFGKASEFILPSIALILIFSIGYWLIHNSKTSIAPGESQPIQTKQKITTQTNEVESQNSITGKNNQDKVLSSDVKQKDNAVLTKSISPGSNEKSFSKVTLTDETSAVQNTKSVANNPDQTNYSANMNDVNPNKSNANSSKQFDPAIINNVPSNDVYNDPAPSNNGDLNAAENRPVRHRTNIQDASTSKPNNTTDNNISSKSSSAAYVTVPEYVQMNEGSGAIKVQNISDIDLELVIVDVLYYDGASQFKKGETLYLHNLRAGKSLTLKTPRDVNVSYATAKISMVSSDEKGVYAIGDN